MMKRSSLGFALGIAVGATIALSSMDARANEHPARTEAPKRSEVAVRGIFVDVTVPIAHARDPHVYLVCTRATVCEDARRTPVQTVKHTARVAVTLGRALVTTVGAVVDSLVEAAVGATASLV